MADKDPSGKQAPSPDDFVLVERTVQGDRRAFETLVRRHERRVFRVAMAVLGNAEDAEEAMQDAFIKAFRHLGQFRREARFSTWLTRIAVNASIEKRNARKNYAPLAEAETGEQPFSPKRFEPWRNNPEEAYGKQEIHQMVERAIEALPEIYREAFVLRDIEGLKADEAAAALGISVPALKSRLLRARLMMREALAARLEEPPGLKRKVAHAAVDAGTAMAMRLMRAAGR